MLVVLPFCAKDIDLAAKNLEWCISMEGTAPFPALVAYEDNVNPDKILQLARKYFSKVDVLKYDKYTGSPVWPAPQNYSWQTVARYISANYDQSWLWWEADATPLKPGWLKSIEECHVAGGKPFTGHIVDRLGHMNGVGVYPPQIENYSHRALLVREKHPFDRVLGLDIKGSVNKANHLFAHYVKSNQDGYHFTGIDEVNLLLEGDAVIFHGAQDGSLVDYLMHRKPDSVGLMQTLMKWKYAKGRFKSAKQTVGKLVSFIIPKPQPKIVHCLERHKQRDKDSERRVQQAQDSWVSLYKTGVVVPCHVWDYPRNSEQLGDSRCLPYLKDILLAGMNMARENDIIMWTNDDTILHSQIPDVVTDEVASKGAISSFRVNFERGKIPKLDTPISEILKKGDDVDIGRDLFAFRKSWLREHWYEIPDFLLGELEFDLVMAYLIRKHAGIKTTKMNVDKVVDACELPKGYVLHEKHERLWISRSTAASPAKIHNRKLSAEWCSDNDLHWMIATKV